MSQNDTHPTPEKRLPGQQLSDEQRAAAQVKFLKSFSRDANVLKAAKSAKVHRSTIYDWLEKDETFSFLYNQAKEDAKDVLRAEIKRRAHDGWYEPIYQKGELVGKVRKYSDTLLIFHAKMMMPEYRDKSQLDVTANVTTNAGTISIDTRAMTADQLARLKAIALELKAGNNG